MFEDEYYLNARCNVRSLPDYSNAMTCPQPYIRLCTMIVFQNVKPEFSRSKHCFSGATRHDARATDDMLVQARPLITQ